MRASQLLLPQEPLGHDSTTHPRTAHWKDSDGEFEHSTCHVPVMFFTLDGLQGGRLALQSARPPCWLSNDAGL